jgi:transcription antitermination factor NusG
MIDLNWYAVTVKPRHERVVAQCFRHQSLEEFLPLFRSRRVWSDRAKEIDLPLISGYVFCRFHQRDRVRVLRTPGVTGLVGFGGVPAPLGDGDIEALGRVAASGCRTMPWPFLRAGQRVRIRNGPLAGLEGVVLESRGSWRLVVSVCLLQRSVAVEIGREALEAAGGRTAPGALAPVNV